MSEQGQLVLEVLNGPLDGAIITLRVDTEWSRVGNEPLTFPWDEELGKPQARFQVDDQGWSLHAFKSPHGTYRINQNERITSGRLQLDEGDVLKASDTWLLVQHVSA